MSRNRALDRLRLAAFADGELSPEEAAEVVMHLADHPEDQAYVDDLMAANAALARAFFAPMAEPVPPAILATIAGQPAEQPAADRAPARVIAFPQRQMAGYGALALAAAIALAAVLWPSAPGAPIPLGPVASGHDLHDHLQTLPSGQTTGFDGNRQLTILATLPTDIGPCREVEIVDRSEARLDMLLACHDGAGWVVETAMSEPLPTAAADAPDYVPAAGLDAEAFGLWLDRLGAGMALDAAAEAAIIARGWTP